MSFEMAALFVVGILAVEGALNLLSWKFPAISRCWLLRRIPASTNPVDAERREN